MVGKIHHRILNTVLSVRIITFAFRSNRFDVKPPKKTNFSHQLMEWGDEKS